MSSDNKTDTPIDDKAYDSVQTGSRSETSRGNTPKLFTGHSTMDGSCDGDGRSGIADSQDAYRGNAYARWAFWFGQVGAWCLPVVGSLIAIYLGVRGIQQARALAQGRGWTAFQIWLSVWGILMAVVALIIIPLIVLLQ